MVADRQEGVLNALIKIGDLSPVSQGIDGRCIPAVQFAQGVLISAGQCV